MKVLQISLPDELYAEFKSKCVQEETAMDMAITRLIADYVRGKDVDQERKHEPG